MKLFPSLPVDYPEKVQEVMVLVLDPDQIGRLSAHRMTSPVASWNICHHSDGSDKRDGRFERPFVSGAKGEGGLHSNSMN
jgi:hypothetical protein